MNKAELDARLRRAGLKKKELAALLGQHASHVSQLGATKKVQPYVRSIIAAWEFMSVANRKKWLAQAESKD